MAGTNAAAVVCEDVDILAHPGFITADEVQTSIENDVCLEITARNGHNRTNGYVAKIGMELGATLVVNTDTHSPGNLMTRDFARKVAMGSGLSESEAESVLNNSLRFLE